MTTDGKNDNKDFGRYLVQFRSAQGKTIEEVAEQTKISIDFLKRIENEDLSGLPATVFVKGFIRAYAAAVSADPGEALQRFERFHDDKQQEEAVGDPTLLINSRFWLNLFISLFLFAVLIAATLLMTSFRISSDNAVIEDNFASPENSSISSQAQTAEPKTVREEIDLVDNAGPDAAGDVEQPSDTFEHHGDPNTMADTVIEPSVANPETKSEHILPNEKEISNPEENEPSLPNEKEISQPEESKPLKLYISALASTWLKVTIDEQLPKEMLLQPGDSVVLVGTSRFDLFLGNAGGVNLKLNDRIIGVPGAQGQVKQLELP